jgi:hypothetical protein
VGSNISTCSGGGRGWVSRRMVCAETILLQFFFGMVCYRVVHVRVRMRAHVHVNWCGVV